MTIAAGAFAALFAISAATAQSVKDNDRIKRFAAEVVVKENGDLIVSEEIDFLVTPGSRKRGIYRDFPTSYVDALGFRKTAGFEVLGVTRNGRNEAFVLESHPAGVRVRIGQEQVFLPEQRHRYILRYRTDNQLLFLEEADELYWNVTGNDWAHPIDLAQVRIHLPGNAEPLEVTGYTGHTGETGQDFKQRQLADGSVIFDVNRTLEPGEGLTVAVSWPKGFVAVENGGIKLTDNLGLVAGIIGFVIVLAYFCIQWRRVGRDPEKGVVIPRFTAPEGLSPAATGFIWGLPRNRKLSRIEAFVVVLTSLAIKGQVSIEETVDESFVLRPATGAKEAKRLSPGEASVMKNLFADDAREIILERRYDRTVQKTVYELEDVLRREYQSRYFRHNILLWAIGGVLALASILTALILQYRDVFFLIIALSSAITVFSFTLTGSGWVHRSLRKMLVVGRIGTAKVLYFLLTLVLLLPNGIPLAIALYLILEHFGILMLALVVGTLAVVLLFWFLMKSPTRQGREILDQIEGYKLYLSVAEGDRLNSLTAEPEMTPEAFEHHLPYAMALGVEKEWSDRFSAGASAAAVRQVQQAPQWYRSRRHSRQMTSIASSLSGSLSSTLTTASTSPRSSSSSSGGSSGGGGGGGGGGSW